MGFVQHLFASLALFFMQRTIAKTGHFREAIIQAAGNPLRWQKDWVRESFPAHADQAAALGIDPPYIAHSYPHLVADIAKISIWIGGCLYTPWNLFPGDVIKQAPTKHP